jgi:hypothetical protein
VAIIAPELIARQQARVKAAEAKLAPLRERRARATPDGDGDGRAEHA